jgi:two-component system nitrate/nitrite sensor histidine kinase NarX
MNTARKHLLAPDSQDQRYWEIFEAVSDGLIIQDAKTHRVLDANLAAAAMHGYSREEFIGLHLADYIHPDSHRLFIKNARADPDSGMSETPAIHIHKDGSSFYVEVRRSAFTYQSRPCLLSVVRDISKQVRAEELLYRQVEIRQREQIILLDISRILASTLELKPDLILDQLRGIVQYSQAALFVLEESTLVAVASRGLQHLEGATSFRIPLDDPQVLARLLNEHHPTQVADLSDDNKQVKSLHALFDRNVPFLLSGMHAWMWVPLSVQGRVIGGMGVAHVEPNYFTSHHADLALTVANQAAITMINAELYKNAQSLAAMQERQRLAQNLHDAVNQSLFSAGVIAEVLPRLWERDQELARQALEDLRKLTRGAMAEMRALLAELRPSTLTDANLGELLGLLGNAFIGRTSMPVKVSIVGEGVLPAEVQVALYRICQEALNNVAKHAGASSVEIQVKQAANAIELSIRDDGRGFDPKPSASGHYGLGMMQERAETVGAQLSIVSQPGHGTELSLRWAQEPPKEPL